MQSLLAEALRDDKLIPFERLHPSIAMLPSQREAGLAFAQVATFMEEFLREHGREGMRTLMAGVASGRDVQQVLTDITQQGFALQEDRWRSRISARYTTTGKLRSPGRRFKNGDAQNDDSLDIPEEAARRFVRLGDMLWEMARRSFVSSL